MTDEIMTTKQVAEYLKLNLMTVYRLAREGKLPASRIGRSWRFKRDAVEKLLAEQPSRVNSGEKVAQAE